MFGDRDKGFCSIAGFEIRKYQPRSTTQRKLRFNSPMTQQFATLPADFDPGLALMLGGIYLLILTSSVYAYVWALSQIPFVFLFCRLPRAMLDGARKHLGARPGESTKFRVSRIVGGILVFGSVFALGEIVKHLILQTDAHPHIVEILSDLGAGLIGAVIAESAREAMPRIVAEHRAAEALKLPPLV
jgi:hypothetical protein